MSAEGLATKIIETNRYLVHGGPNLKGEGYVWTVAAAYRLDGKKLSYEPCALRGSGPTLMAAVEDLLMQLNSAGQ